MRVTCYNICVNDTTRQRVLEHIVAYVLPGLGIHQSWMSTAHRGVREWGREIVTCGQIDKCMYRTYHNINTTLSAQCCIYADSAFSDRLFWDVQELDADEKELTQTADSHQNHMI